MHTSFLTKALVTFSDVVNDRYSHLVYFNIYFEHFGSLVIEVANNKRDKNMVHKISVLSDALKRLQA